MLLPSRQPHAVLGRAAQVPGTGAGAGAPLVKHKGVAKVAFTGSVATGSRIMGMCAADVKGLSLELGGKSPAIVFADADIEKAVEWVMFGCFWTNGQICSATSRCVGLVARVTSPHVR